MNDKTIQYYSQNAERLASQYDGLAFESVHKDWLHQIPKEGMVLDVGAGSGRDARYFAEKGLSVVAVEPASGIRDIAQGYGVAKSIHWIADSLPELSKVINLQTKFDLILLSAVWMHIPATHRERSFRKLSSLLKPNGKLIITLRHSTESSSHHVDERKMFPVSSSELATYAKQYGLSYQLVSAGTQEDQLGRDEVTWQTVLLTLPDDGTGAFPLIRNIVVNDSKSSTYKVALMRSLLRIAEGHPGAIISQDEKYVTLPLGLVAVYWMKLFKPLLDTFSMQQNSNANVGLGFVKVNGWDQLSALSGNDVYLGAKFIEEKQARAFHQTIKDIVRTIKNMPVKYITLPGTDKSVFEVEIYRTKKLNQVTLDFDYLSSIGKINIPTEIWNALTRFSIWIEPTLVNEWINLMSGYANNQKRGFGRADYFEALRWENPERSTQAVRSRVNYMLSENRVKCCWSGKELTANDYVIDHAFPFARWPNNDLWNLLPTKTKVNSIKSDKLPSRFKVYQSKELILDWWQQGWKIDELTFFTQANMALPNLSHTNRNYNDVFEAFAFQRDRIKDLQQLKEWP